MNPAKPILLVLFSFSIIATSAQDLLVSVNKSFKTDLFLDPTVVFNASEFTSISPFTFFGFNFSGAVPLAMYSKAENVYDSTNALKVAKISGDVSGFYMEDGIRFEDVYTALTYEGSKEKIIVIENVDTKKEAIIAFTRKIKGLPKNKYPYLVYTEKVGNRLSSTIFIISKVTTK